MTEIWQWRSKREVRRGNIDWHTPRRSESPTNPAYRERWSDEYEFRLKPPESIPSTKEAETRK